MPYSDRIAAWQTWLASHRTNNTGTAANFATIATVMAGVGVNSITRYDNFTIAGPTAAQTGARAQTSAPPANAQAAVPVKQAIAPKQVGLWTVIGWTRATAASHCSAERPVRGAAGDGGAVQFALVRWSGGYRIALGSDDWELTPQTAFPIELIANPVFRSDANALAIGPKIVMIELGADGQFMRKLSTAAMIEVKTAQAVIKLPLEGFASALAEVDQVPIRSQRRGLRRNPPPECPRPTRRPSRPRP